ncbi:MAG: ferrochelatase [Deltaproteobacteria bacterium]|nr:ferrochelatase [Deltaproteobacteria bacterium]
MTQATPFFKAASQKDSKKRIGVILAQLGTPDDASPAAVKRYLKEFLSDPHVIEVWRPLWYFILNGIILRTRPQQSALLYQRLFSTYGRVLVTYSESLLKKVYESFPESDNTVFFEIGMRYGKPSLKQAVETLVNTHKCDQLYIAPLFPQYSNTSTGSVVDLVTSVVSKMRCKPGLRFLEPFYAEDFFLEPLAHNINKALEARQQAPEKIIFSYHGIPQRYAKKGDPYARHCVATTNALADKIDFPRRQILHCYQSRFGKEPWLKPYLDERLQQLAKEGIKDILIVSPAFTIDCLETLDELGYESKKLFKAHGGDTLELVSCVNDDAHWAQLLAKKIHKDIS